MVTTTSITAVSVSMRSAQSQVERRRTWIQRMTSTLSRRGMRRRPPPLSAAAERSTGRKTTQDSTAATISRPVVMYSLGRWPMMRPNRPAISAPSSGQEDDGLDHTVAQPFIMLTSSTAIEPRLRKKTTRMARPIAASAAATVRTNSAKTCPTRSPR